MRGNFSKEKIAEFCRRHHIRRRSLFGSVLRDDFGPDSDIDLLVEFQPDHVPGFFGLHERQEELSLIFEGRRVELLTPQDLSPYFRDEVIATDYKALLMNFWTCRRVNQISGEKREYRSI